MLTQKEIRAYKEVKSATKVSVFLTVCLWVVKEGGKAALEAFKYIG